MVLRVAALLHKPGLRRSALVQGLRSYPEDIDLCFVRTFLQLIAFRPNLILADDVGSMTSWAAIYRATSFRSRLVLNSVEPRARFGTLGRVVFEQADGVLADGDIVSETLRQQGVRAERIFPLATPIALDDPPRGEIEVADHVAHRLAFVGALSPRHGAADLLAAIMVWADHNKDRSLEIYWIGEGDLTGVLRAQPLPENVHQKFLPGLPPEKIAATLASCGMLVIPSLTTDNDYPVEQALEAGLPVLGSTQDGRVRRLIREDFNGWLFDPLRPGDMLGALGRAMRSSAAHRDELRQNACRVARPTYRHFEDRLFQAVHAVLHGARIERCDETERWAPARSAR